MNHEKIIDALEGCCSIKPVGATSSGKFGLASVLDRARAATILKVLELEATRLGHIQADCRQPQCMASYNEQLAAAKKAAGWEGE